MIEFSYPFWQDFGFILLADGAVVAVFYVLLGIFSHGFKCSKKVIFIPNVISFVVCMIGIAVMLFSNDGTVQLAFLVVATYSAVIFVISGITAVGIMLINRIKVRKRGAK